MNQREEIFGTVYEKGKVIFHEGDTGNEMYVIQSGAVEVSQTRDGKEQMVAVLGRNEFFGEMALIDAGPRSATVRTVSRSRLLSLSCDSFMKRVTDDPGMVFHLLHALSSRIEKTNDLLRKRVEEDITLRTVLSRSAKKDLNNEFHPDENIEKPAHYASDKNIDVFASSGDDPLTEKVASLTSYFSADEIISCHAGEVICREGETGDSLHIIGEGLVEVSQEREGVKTVIARLGASDFFGEMSLITGRPRTATVISLKKTRVLSIKRDMFLVRIKQHPEVALYILQIMILRLRRALDALSCPTELHDLLHHHVPLIIRQNKRMTIGILSLSTCGGCASALLDNQHELSELLEKASISYCPMLMDEVEIKKVDMVLIDGVVRVREDEEKLKEAVRKSRYTVAWGTCSTFGGVPAFANRFHLEELIDESYGDTLDAFSLYLSGVKGVHHDTYQTDDMAILRRAGKADDFVRVDYYLPGCPPRMTFLSQLLKELEGEYIAGKYARLVCTECNRTYQKNDVGGMLISLPTANNDPEKCFLSVGTFCMGFLIRGGCEAICTNGGLPCWGCRGPSDVILKRMAQGNGFEELVLLSLVRRSRLSNDKVNQTLKTMRNYGNSTFAFDHNLGGILGRIR